MWNLRPPTADPLLESSSGVEYKVGECMWILRPPSADPLWESSSTTKYKAGQRIRILCRPLQTHCARPQVWYK